jgi:hypothetical protein
MFWRKWRDWFGGSQMCAANHVPSRYRGRPKKRPCRAGALNRSSHPFDVPLGNIFALYHSPYMSSNLKTNEWNLLKEFDALVHNEGVREDNLEQALDKQIRRRFGELIAWAAGHKAKGYHGPWPPGPYRANR